MILLKRLSKTEVKYGILTTRKGLFRNMLPSFGQKVVFVDSDDNMHKLCMHQSVLGRIDGLTDLYRAYGVGEGDYVSIDKNDNGNFIIIFWTLNLKKRLENN